MIDVPKLLVFVGFIDIYKWLGSFWKRRQKAQNVLLRRCKITCNIIWVTEFVTYICYNINLRNIRTR